MNDLESFEDKLNRWTLSELMIEKTKTNIYSARKLSRIETRIAELQYGQGAAPLVNIRSDTYVSANRIEKLRNIYSPQFDLQRLVRLCEELNSSWQYSNFLCVGALTRIVIDHIPPVFGCKTFAQVAASSSRSTKAVLEQLEKNSRNISDALIHQQIRRKETLPSEQMVNFSHNLDVLLSEVIRVIEEANA